MKSYRAWSPTQSFLLPPSPLELLPEGHLAYFVLEVSQALDLAAIEDAIQEKDGPGERPYPPAMMVALLVYGYCVGVFSSRRLARATYEEQAEDSALSVGERHAIGGADSLRAASLPAVPAECEITRKRDRLPGWHPFRHARGGLRAHPRDPRVGEARALLPSAQRGAQPNDHAGKHFPQAPRFPRHGGTPFM